MKKIIISIIAWILVALGIILEMTGVDQLSNGPAWLIILVLIGTSMLIDTHRVEHEEEQS